MQAPGTDSMDVDTTDAHMVEAPLDPTHRSDPQECNHYVNEIYAYLQELEVQYQVTVRARVLPSCVCNNGSHAPDGFTRGVRMWIRRSTC